MIYRCPVCIKGRRPRLGAILSGVVLALASVQAGADQMTISYAYDALGRLVLANYSSGSKGSYVYDAAGNILAVSPGGMVTYQRNVITAPAPDQRLVAGSQSTISWDSAALRGETISVYLIDDALDGMPYDYRMFDRKSWTLVSNKIANNGVFLFDPGNAGVFGEAIRVLVVADSGDWSVSEGLFSIAHGLALPLGRRGGWRALLPFN